ncbi:thermonuclease family protein [Pokkaliibacter sp. CJK22405]|uniref:thermonuclease family protein n=1 Tax=Pokkaliibacter sp. CJK22405 TaxID=3384615 RepID=UPI003984F429
MMCSSGLQKWLRAALLLGFSLLAQTAFSAGKDQEMVGVVSYVVDGDTLYINAQSPSGEKPKRVKVRLRGIDAPEYDQPYGLEAKAWLAEQVSHHKVHIRYQGYDDYGRMLGTVYLGKTNINLALVKNGAAWAYRQYKPGKRILDAEMNARQARLGLWHSGAAIAPWVWRHSKR